MEIPTDLSTAKCALPGCLANPWHSPLLCVSRATKPNPTAAQRCRSADAHRAARVHWQAVERAAPDDLLPRHIGDAGKLVSIAIIVGGPFPRIAGHVETAKGACAFGKTADNIQAARRNSCGADVGV